MSFQEHISLGLSADSQNGLISQLSDTGKAKELY
jgi:hypothetical protein